MGKEDMLLLWGSGSSPCVRVMIALEEKGFSGYPQKRLDFSKGEHKSAEVLALNPRGQVPAFKDGDVVVNESYAILHYLQHRYPDSGTNLLPGSPKEQAFALQRYYEVKSNLAGAYSLLYRALAYGKDPQEVKQKNALAFSETFLKELATFDQYMAKSQYIAGDTFTLGDIDLVTVLMMCERQALKLEERFPNLYAYYQRTKARPSVVASYPPHFKTSESPKMLAEY